MAPGQRIQVNVNGDTVFGTPGVTCSPRSPRSRTRSDTDPSQLDSAQRDAEHPDDGRAERARLSWSAISTRRCAQEPKHFRWADDETEPVFDRGRRHRPGDDESADATGRVPGGVAGNRPGYPTVARRLPSVGTTMIETQTATDVVEITFPAGLPGFPNAHRFELAPWGPAGSPFLLLSSSDDPEVGFVVVPPWVFYPEYEFELDNGTAERLWLAQAEDAVVFAVVTLRDVPRTPR